MCAAGTYLCDGKGLGEEVRCATLEWTNLTLERVSGRPSHYSSLFPKAGTYGLRSCGTESLETESAGGFVVETVEVARKVCSEVKVGKLMLVDGRPKPIVLSELRRRYQDAVVIRR